ncbi:MAG: hypothetical protein QXU32_01320 [Nitrososphaerales archaeon]
MDENLMRKEIESLLNNAENYLVLAKFKKRKDVKNFEGILALEYAIKAKEKCKTLRHDEEFYESITKRIEIIFDELNKLPLSTGEKSHETKYEEGDVAGG